MPTHDDPHPHRHEHEPDGHDHAETEHRHTHGAVDPSILTTSRGIWAVKWSFIGLFLTAVLQIVVVWYTGSVALLADTIHNLGDAATAVPLWIAFVLVRKKPSKRFTYGLGRVEDLAGVFIVLMILLTAVIAGYESISRLITPQPVVNLWAVIVASLVGFAGNEGVALFRIKVGREIGSAALVADGHHARSDGLTSLAVLIGAIGVWAGFPIADPLIGLVITFLIMRIVWDSAKLVFTRILDGVEPGVVDQITEAAKGGSGVTDVSEVRVRWLGHRLHAEVNVAVDAHLTVSDAHHIAVRTQRHLLENVNYLSSATIHIDPENASGESHHQLTDEHAQEEPRRDHRH